jgi:DNA polymerase III subunit delta
MIIKNFEIKNFINKKNIFLIYGENRGLKEDIILEISKSFSKESIITYDEKDILNNGDNFYNNIFSQSFFDNQKLILINNASDKFKNEIDKILTKQISDITLVLTSNILEKKSKLRNLFEKEKELICIPVYKDDKRTLLNIGYSFFKSKNINISTESINLIVERSSEDRKNLRNELFKVAIFVGKKGKVDMEDLVKLTNLSENYSINKIVDLSLAKDTKQTLRTLNENIFSKEDVIIIIRSFLIKSKRLLKLIREFEKNNNLDQTISTSRPPIFWKDKDIVKKQIKTWTTTGVEKLIQKINIIELQLKKNTESSINIICDFIIEQSSKSNN